MHDRELGQKYRRIAAQIVGRSRELELLLTAVAAGRDILLEGPPGTSKTTMLKAITSEWGIPFVLVEGNGELTPVKLVGHHDPAAVLRSGYTPENFIAGPLLTAMTEGGFLYIEEFNRAPEDTLNTLLMAIAEREIAVPRVGVIRAAPSFRLIASMNPFDSVGTVRISAGVYDRMCRLAVGYQDAEAERSIVALRTALDEGPLAHRLVDDSVAITRATRSHHDVRQGSSVRGAIDAALIGATLCALREITDPADERYAPMLLDALIVALSGRIQLDEVADTTPEHVLRELWEDHLVLTAAPAAPG